MNYLSHRTEDELEKGYNDSIQVKAHLDFVNNVCINQTENLYGSKDIERMINEYLLDAIIIGSDAVVQHHPLFQEFIKEEGSLFI